MGYEIVYCATCQSQVRGTDLEKRLAIRLDDQAYCAKCAPAILKTLPPQRADEILGRIPSPPPVRKGSSSHIRKVQSKTSGHLKAQPAAPAPPAAPPPPAPRKGLLIGAAVGAAGLVALVVVLMTSGGSAPEPKGKEAAPPPPPPTASARPRSGDDLAAATALIDLEQLAATASDPFEVLTRCDEIASVVRGTPHEAKWRAIRERATEAKKVRDADRAITLGLEQVRSLRKFDVRFEKKAEIERLLDRMKEMGGPRKGEVQAVAEDYAKDAAEAAVRLRDLAAWYRFSMAERLGADDSGRGNNAASAEGVVWNGGDPDRGAAARFSGSAVLAVPVSVREDMTIAFWVCTRQAPVGDNQWFQGPGLVDAEVPGVVEDFGTSLLRGKFAFGIGNPDTTLVSRTEINDGRWHHVAASRSSAGGEMKIYVDGAPEGTMSGPKGARTAPQRIAIGGLQTGALPFSGDLNDVRIYSRVLPAEEIASLARRKDGK
jgi:hypothetical protein